jgi:type II secretory pathway pseudopilin PulG
MGLIRIGKFAAGPQRRSGRRHPGSALPAFSLIDLLITVGLIGLLGTLVLSALSRGRMMARSTLCLANLRNISLGLQQYTAENANRYPDPKNVGRSWESLIEPYLKQPMVFACPSDDEVFPSIGSSYDWRDTANPLTTLSGRPSTLPLRGEGVLAFESLPGWHQKHWMNAVLVNGSARAMSDDACLGDLMLPICTANTPGAGSQ